MRVSPDFLRGLRLALPIILGYLPVGLAFGVLAVQAGMDVLTVGLMSCLVYAGSAQLIAVGLMAEGVGIVSIIFTVFVVNLRHLLMSAALAPYLRRWSRPLQAWFCFEMTDETFAANMNRFASTGVNKAEAIGLNGLSHLFWALGGILGALFGGIIGDVRPLGLDFALPGMFIALLLPHVRVPRRLLALCSGACFSLIFAIAGTGQWNVILATLCAATIAAFWPMEDRPASTGPGLAAAPESGDSPFAAAPESNGTALAAAPESGDAALAARQAQGQKEDDGHA